MFQFLLAITNIAISWLNTVVDVPLNSSIDQFKTEPYAILLINDIKETDPNMYYEYEAWTTSFNVINTGIVGEYHVLYRVYFPKYSFSSEQMITFRIVDQIKPEINANKDIYLDVGTKLPDFKTFINYFDNYDLAKDLFLTIDTTRVNMNALGIYPVTYQVKDSSGNIESFIQNVHIVDEVSPIITQKKEVTLNIGEYIEIDKYFNISDNLDKVLKINIIDSNINYQKLGNYSAQIEASDQSGNITRINFEVRIVDNTEPLIVLTTNKITINYKDKINEEYFRSYIQYVKDNIDVISIDDVTIDSYVQTNFLGTYEVIYSVYDSSNHIGESKLQVVVADIEPPKVEVFSDLVFEVGTLEPYLQDYLLITDNYDKKDKLTISQSGKIDMTKIGDNRVIITIKDTAKNETTIPLVISILDQTAPKVEVLDDIIVSNFTKPNYLNYLSITDNYDKNFNIVIHDKLVDYGSLGVYQVKLEVADASANTTYQTITLKIVDETEPEIILNNQTSYVNYGDDVNLKSFIQEVYDNYDDVSIDDVKIITDLDINKVGVYEVRFELNDKSSNIGDNYLYLYVVDYDLPTLTIKPITIKEGTQLNIHDFVEAYDLYDGNISDEVKMFPSYIPTNVPGLYEVTFYVHDSSGNLAQEKVMIVVEYQNPWEDYIIYGIGLLIIITGGIFFYYFHNKRAKF